MKAMLDIDVGNTLVKWRIVKNHQVIYAEKYSSADQQLDELVLAMVRSIPGKIDKCRISCVKSPQYQDRLTCQLQLQLGVPVKSPKPSSGVGGLIIEGVDPQRLGCDRWLAMLSAKEKYPHQELMVVDCGTAVTLDRVSQQGCFLGGLIMPGLRPMQKAVLATADRLVMPNSDCFDRSLSKSSAQSVQNGLISMILCVLEKEYVASSGGVRMVLTGGDALTVIELLEVAVDYEPELVMDGLALAVP